MKKLKVKILNQDTLSLKEDGKAGDIIDLKELMEIDRTPILEAIEAGKDAIYNDKLNRTRESLKKDYEISIEKKEIEYMKKIYELTNEFNDKIRKLEDENATLKRERSRMPSHIIGANLEKWCDDQFNSYGLTLKNVSWEKDTTVVKGSKADFIYKVYLTDEKKEEELITSVILEMKSEDLTAKTKQDLGKIYKKLDTDRKNKNIEYALLVSEIGSDSELTDVYPIRRIQEYEKMYIVRPEYFMIFLNIITALGMNYKELILAKNEHKIEFKEYQELLNEFEKIKEDILEQRIKNISEDLISIIKQTEEIKKANNKIYSLADKILERHLKSIKNKIESFKTTIEKVKCLNRE